MFSPAGVNLLDAVVGHVWASLFWRSSLYNLLYCTALENESLRRPYVLARGGRDFRITRSALIPSQPIRSSHAINPRGCGLLSARHASPNAEEPAPHRTAAFGIRPIHTSAAHARLAPLAHSARPRRSLSSKPRRRLGRHSVDQGRFGGPDGWYASVAALPRLTSLQSGRAAAH